MTVGNIAIRFTSMTSHMMRGFGNANNALLRFGLRAQQLGAQMSALGLQMGFALTLPIIAALAKGVREFVKFEEAMRNVNTLVQVSEEAFAAMGERVLDMALAMGRQPVDMAKALYRINSLLFQGDKGFRLLGIAADTARAGLSGVEETARILGGVLRAYRMGVDHARDASDILFATVIRGDVMFKELLNTIQSVVPVAAGAGIAFGELMAAMATLTRMTHRPRRAAFALNRTFMRLLKPSQQLFDLFKKQLGMTPALAMRTKGLASVFEVLDKATGGSSEAMIKLGFRTRAMRAVITLLSAYTKEFAVDLKTVGNAAWRAGKTLQALEQQKKTLKYQLDRLRAAMTIFAILLGKAMAPTVRWLVERVISLVVWFRNLDEETRVLVVRIALFVAALGPALLFVGMLVSLVGKLIIGFFMLLTPLGMSVALLIALVTYLFWDAAKGDTWIEKLKNVFLDFPGTLQSLLINLKIFWATVGADLDIMIIRWSVGWKNLVRGVLGNILILMNAWDRMFGHPSMTDEQLGLMIGKKTDPNKAILGITTKRDAKIREAIFGPSPFPSFEEAFLGKGKELLGPEYTDKVMKAIMDIMNLPMEGVGGGRRKREELEALEKGTVAAYKAEIAWGRNTAVSRDTERNKILASIDRTSKAQAASLKEVASKEIDIMTLAGAAGWSQVGTTL